MPVSLILHSFRNVKDPTSFLESPLMRLGGTFEWMVRGLGVAFSMQIDALKPGLKAAPALDNQFPPASKIPCPLIGDFGKRHYYCPHIAAELDFHHIVATGCCKSIDRARREL